jgi:WD40 repeat protein
VEKEKRMKKMALVALLMWGWMQAAEYAPVQEIRINGAAKDIVLHGNRLIVGTDHGRLQVYDYVEKKFVKEIRIPDIKDFMGDTISARVASVDYMDGRYLLLSDSGVGGYADLRIHEDNVTRSILDENDKRPVIKVRFLDKDHVVMAYLSNEVSLLDLRNKKEIYRVQLSESKFSDMALNEDRTLMAVSCESGEIAVLETKTGKILRRLSGINLDNVYKVDIKKDYVSGAGQDRRASWYNWRSGKGGYFPGNFLIYATGLSPSARRVAYAMDEQNDITVFDLGSGSRIALLKGQKSTLNAIVFKDDTTLFSASDDDTVMMWRIK